MANALYTIDGAKGIYGSSGITYPECETEAKAEYFTLQGHRIASRPTEAGIYIMRRGTSVSKIIIR